MNMAAPLKRLRFTLTALSQYITPNAQQLYIDGVSARIVVLESSDEGSSFQLTIDGVAAGSFMTTASGSTDSAGPFSIDFPPMRDEHNRLIRYDQRLRISAGNLTPVKQRGYIIQFYEVDALPTR